MQRTENPMMHHRPKKMAAVPCWKKDHSFQPFSFIGVGGMTHRMVPFIELRKLCILPKTMDVKEKRSAGFTFTPPPGKDVDAVVLLLLLMFLSLLLFLLLMLFLLLLLLLLLLL